MLLVPFGARQRGLGRRQAGDRHPERRAAHVVQPDLVAERDRLGIAAVLAADAKLDVRSRRAPGWFLPVAGGLLFALLIVAVLTSAGWYLEEKGWPS